MVSDRQMLDSQKIGPTSLQMKLAVSGAFTSGTELQSLPFHLYFKQLYEKRTLILGLN